jgi:hypothetical protein
LSVRWHFVAKCNGLRQYYRRSAVSPSRDVYYRLDTKGLEPNDHALAQM